MSTRKRKFTLEDAFEKEIFKQPAIGLSHWMDDGNRLCYLFEQPGKKFNTIWMLDATTGETNRLLDAKNVRIKAKPGIDNFLWSPDETKLLFNSKGPMRISESGYLSLYDTKTGEIKRLLETRKGMRNAKFSPDGKRVGLVCADDLMVVDLATGKQTQLTNMAKKNVYVGRFGWVYEEELGLVDGWEWSPDGKLIAFYLVDERGVPEFVITDFMPQHTKPVRMHYPKAGDPNPRTRIGVVPAAGGEVVWVDTQHEDDGYLIRTQWTDDGKLLIQRMPRLQNRIDVLLADPKTGKCKVILTEADERWVEGSGKLTFLPGGKEFVWVSERSGWRHLYLYNLKGELIRQLTEGKFEVAKLDAVDAENAYFSAAHPRPTERNLYSVPLAGGKMKRITQGPGCHDVRMARNGKQYLATCSDLNNPPGTAVYTNAGKRARWLLEPGNKKLERFAMSRWEILSFKTSDGVQLTGKLMLPVGFDPKKRYPVLISTYGGPGSQVVTDRWGEDYWSQYLAQRGFVLFMCDGRGSASRGAEFKKVVYKNLGHWEAHDQIEGAKYLAGLDFVDPKRIAIWGWSYGGYLSCLTALLGGEVFRAAMCVASVIHWELYDSVYTERYMQTPQLNPDGYKESAPENHAEKLACAMLLVHGVADDNVHFQNSMRMSAALQKAGKQFACMYYPGKKHGIEGMRCHIYRLFERFLRVSL